MTTQIVVKALHGWPVKVFRLNPRQTVTNEDGVEFVQAGREQSFMIYEGQDLLIREIQPNDKDFAENGGKV